MAKGLHPERSSGVSFVERLPAADFPLRLVDLDLTASSPRDSRSDRARFEDGLCEALGSPEVNVPVSVVRELADILAASDRKVTVTVRSSGEAGERWEATRVRSSADPAPWYLAVLDLGPARVWGQLLDGETGRVIVTAMGDGPAEVIERMGLRCGAVKGSIEHVVIAGGRAVVDRFLGTGPLRLPADPHVLPVPPSGMVAASELGLEGYVSAGAVVVAVPGARESLGGDAVGGAVVSGIANGESVCLYIDIGPEGAAIVGNREGLLAASLPSGPVFEGGGLSNGVGAVPGAIEGVTIDPRSLKAAVSTIDDAAPVGLCGAGVIETVAGLLRAGIVRTDGRFDATASSPRLRKAEGQWEFVLVPAVGSGTGADIVITESDLEGVMQTKAAVYAGMTALLKAASLDWAQLHKILIGGMPGRRLGIEGAMAIGLFPQLEPGRFEFIGNASLLAARAVATSRRLTGRAGQIAAALRTVDLTGDPLFQAEYEAALLMPQPGGRGSGTAGGRM